MEKLNRTLTPTPSGREGTRQEREEPDWTVQDYWKQRGREGGSGKEREVEISMQISKVVQLLINVYTY